MTKRNSVTANEGKRYEAILFWILFECNTFVVLRI